jgi:hypothetical protein
MDDNSPSRLPAHKGRRRSHQQQIRTDGQNHSTVPTPSHLHIHHRLGIRSHFLREKPSPLVQAVINLDNEWSQKYITGSWEAATDPSPTPAPVSWELDPTPLTANHPPRITDSNTRVTLREGSLKEPLPKSDNGLGWVQIQQKSLQWEEHIQGSPIITHEGLTTLVHPTRGWTIASGTWNALRAKWGLTSETLQRIYESCATQRHLETASIFTPTRHILQTIKQVWHVEGIHGLPAVSALGTRIPGGR